MRPFLRCAVLAAAFVVFGCPGAGAADALTTTLRWLRGDWSGNGTTIRIDPDRLQANTDPTKPFQWEAFRLRNVTGCMVTFDIGPRRFVALMFRDRALHINNVGWTGQVILRADKNRHLPNLPCPDEPKPQDLPVTP